MPKCVKCNEFLPPNYTEVIVNSQPDQKGDYPQQCIFCKSGLDEVELEVERDSGKFTKKFTKNECLAEYKEFLKKVKDSKNVKDIINRTNADDESRIISL